MGSRTGMRSGLARSTGSRLGTRSGVMLPRFRAAPDFPVSDVEQSAAHYERVLGFHREYTGGTPPQFAILSRDGLSIMLRVVPAPEHISPNEQQGGTWDAFFWVRDARALHAELASNGADIVYGPVIHDAYNMEEFAVRDPQGYVLGFGQALAR